MKRWKIAAIFATVLIATLALLRANRPSHHASSLTGVRSSGAVVRLQEGAAVDIATPKRRYRIGVLFPFLSSPFWINEAYGILDQAKKAGVDIVWLSADGYDNVDKQSSQLEDLVTQRVDAILLAATSYSGTASAVDRAAAAGVPVFTHVTSSSSKMVVSAVLDDDITIGNRQAEFMGAALGGKGKVAMLNGPAAAEWSARRVQGFKEVLTRRFPGVRIVAERFGVPDRADAQRLTEDLLTTFQDLNGIFTVADGMAMGAADAINMVGRIKQITITTASFSRETVPYLKSGFIRVNVDENPVLMGRTIVNTVIHGLNGETVPAVVYLPNPSITGANLESINPTEQWAPESWRVP